MVALKMFNNYTNADVLDMSSWLDSIIQKEFSDTIDYFIRQKSSNEAKSMEELCDQIADFIWQSQEMVILRDKVATISKENISKNNSSSHPPKKTIIENSRVAHKTSKSSAAIPSGDAISVSARLGAAPSQSDQRIQAIELLLRTPVSELVYSKAWPKLQQELCEGLCDDNTDVYYLVLKLYARLLSTSSACPLKEGFFGLIEGLTLYYLSRKTYSSLPTIRSGINLNNKFHKQMILVTKCTIEAICELPRKWVRFGEKRLQEILENVLDLLSMHTHNHRSVASDVHGSVLYPFHLFSILDPRACWCRTIAHAAFGRTIFLKLMIRSSNLLRFIMEEILLWLKCYTSQSNGLMFVYENYESGNVSGSMIKITIFVHCLSVLLTLISSERGLIIFPIQTSLEQDPITVYELVLHLLSFLNTYCALKFGLFSKQFLYFIEEAISVLILSNGIKILTENSNQLAWLLVETPNNVIVPTLYQHNVRILEKISGKETGINWILSHSEKRYKEVSARSNGDTRQFHPSSAPTSRSEMSGTSYRLPCIVTLVIDSTSFALKNKDTLNTSAEDVAQLLSLCGKLFGTVNGFMFLENHKSSLLQEAGKLYISLCSINNFSYEEVNERDLLINICLSLEDFFIKLASTPLGFASVSNISGLVNCLMVSHLEHSGKAWHSPQFMHFMKSTLVLGDKTLNVHRRMLLSQSLIELWSSFENENTFITMEEQSRWDIINRFLRHLLSLCSTSDVVSDLLTDTASDNASESSEETLVDVQLSTEPLSLKDLLTIGLECVTPFHVHQMCLFSLHALCQYIDVSAVFLEKLKLQDHLTRLQRDCCSWGAQITKERNTTSITSLDLVPSPRKDQVTIYSENRIFRDHGLINKIRDCCALDFLNLSSSHIASPRAQIRTGRMRAQTDIQRFLQDTRLGLHDNTWLTHAKRAYRMSSHSEMKVSVLLDLLEQVSRCQNLPSLLPCWPTGSVSCSRTEYFMEASQLVVRFGCQQRVLNYHMSALYVEQLEILVSQTCMVLTYPKENISFDWFVASVFLMCSGNIDRSRSVLQRVAMLPTGPLLWPRLSKSPWQSYAILSHQLQGLIVEFLPQEYNVLQSEGIPWWQTMMRIVQQGFLPAIPLSQLPLLVAFYALHSSDYIVYMMTAMLAQFKSQKTGTFLSSRTLAIEHVTDGFLMSDLIPFTDKLARLNRSSAVREKSGMSIH